MVVAFRVFCAGSHGAVNRPSLPIPSTAATLAHEKPGRLHVGDIVHETLETSGGDVLSLFLRVCNFWSGTKDCQPRGSSAESFTLTSSGSSIRPERPEKQTRSDVLSCL